MTENSMEELLSKLRNSVTEKAANPRFVHYKWFVKWHLEIVEMLSKDMHAYYPEADEVTLIALSWMHDYGKIIDYDTQYDHRHIEAGRQEMIRLGFDEAFATKIAESVKIFDKKEQLEHESIEIRIVSSADACSHLNGPWISLFWHENPTLDFEAIMKENVRKLGGEWDLKVTIPEAITAYIELHDTALFHAEGTIRRI
jgi:hypothetical protein